MDSVSPVLTTAEIPTEQVIALDQPQYLPIIVARSMYAEAAHRLHGEFARSD